METLQAKAYKDPFPHLIVEDFYNEKELELIWEELNFYTKPGKLLNQRITLVLYIKQMLMLYH